MNDFSLERIWAWIQMAAATIGGWLGYFLGSSVRTSPGADGAEATAPDRLLLALIIFMALDYLSPAYCAPSRPDGFPAPWAFAAFAGRC